MIPAEIRLEGVKNSVGILVKERGEMSGLVMELTTELEKSRTENEMIKAKLNENTVIISTTSRELRIASDTVGKLSKCLKTKEEEILLLKDALMYQTAQIHSMQQLTEPSDSVDILTAVPSPTRPIYTPPVY